jgi:hypothetical protein
LPNPSPKPGPFLEALLARHESWRNLPLVRRQGPGWVGFALIIQPSPQSDLSGGLDIEEVEGEITITLDYSHVHLNWPPVYKGGRALIWTDANYLIDAILTEKVLSSSGWIGGDQRVGTMHEVEQPPELFVRNLQRLRVRSWLGTFDRDELLNTD